MCWAIFRPRNTPRCLLVWPRKIASGLTNSLSWQGSVGARYFVASLSAKLNSPEAQEKLAAATLLCKLGDTKALEALTNLLGADRPDIRCEAARCLVERRQL